jgi:hypothetical protein
LIDRLQRIDQIGDRSPGIKHVGADVHETARGVRAAGTTGVHLWRRNKAAKGQNNPRSVVDSAGLEKSARSIDQTRPSEAKSGTPPRMRPVTHDWL